MENEKELTAGAAGPTETKAEGETEESPEAQKSEDASAVAQAELPADLPAAYWKLLAEKEEFYGRLLRKQAELENLRKRVQREKEDFLKHATAELIRALLPALDSFERALKHRDSSVPEQFYQGMELIYREVLEVLGRAGLTPVETTGRLFDPHLHQAIETIESTAHRDEEIVEELQRGYKLKQRLLRPAVVKVAVRPKGAAAESDKEGSPKVAN